MKWLSVKKYKMAVVGFHPIFFRLENHNENKDFLGSKIVVGGYSVSQKYTDYLNGQRLEIEGWKVTHFCIPDPIEIEDE